MVQPTPQVLRALNLLKTQELAPVIEHITATRDEALRKLAMCNDVNYMFRLQGEVQAFNNFLDLVGRSTELMQKLR